MTAPERAYVDCRSGQLTRLRAVEPPTYGSPRLANTMWILGCSFNLIYLRDIKMQPAAERMTAPERATAFAVEDKMHGFVRTDRGPMEAPRRASTPWILGCSSDHIGLGCIRMQPQRTETKWIDDAGGCRLGCRHCSPGSHVGVDATVGAVPEGKPMLTSIPALCGPIVAPTVWVGIGMPSRIRYSHLNAGIRTHLTAAVRFHRTGGTNVFENGTSDASAGRDADAATHSDVLEMKVEV